jgi:hypothetical protein
MAGQSMRRSAIGVVPALVPISVTVQVKGFLPFAWPVSVPPVFLRQAGSPSGFASVPG